MRYPSRSKNSFCTLGLKDVRVCFSIGVDDVEVDIIALCDVETDIITFCDDEVGIIALRDIVDTLCDEADIITLCDEVGIIALWDEVKTITALLLPHRSILVLRNIMHRGENHPLLSLFVLLSVPLALSDSISYPTYTTLANRRSESYDNDNVRPQQKISFKSFSPPAAAAARKITQHQHHREIFFYATIFE